MARELSFSLPWPPTLNSYWRHIVIPIGKGAKSAAPGKRTKHRSATILSEDARNYRDSVLGALDAQKLLGRRLTGRLRVEISVFPPDLRDRDLDNLPKGILDSLKNARMFRDDADIDDLRILRKGVLSGGRVLVTITEIPGQPTETADMLEGTA